MYLKKIEAGQAFIGKNNVRINSIIMLKDYYEDLQRNKKANSDFRALAKEAEKSINSLYLDINAYTSLYVDMNGFSVRTEELSSKVIRISGFIDRYVNEDLSESYYPPELDLHVNTFERLASVLEGIYREMNVHVRNDLAKYDLVQVNDQI